MSKLSPWLTFVGGLLTGGLAGAVFNWYVNRPRPTVVAYNVVTTTTGADSTTKGLVPNLKLRIGDEDVSVIYTHTVDFTVQSGPYLESATVAITFPADFRIFGLASESPSPLHHIACNQMASGVRCELGPLAPGTHDKYRVTIATNEAHPVEVLTAANKLELLNFDDYLADESRVERLDRRLNPIGEIASFLAICLGTVMYVINAKRARYLKSLAARLNLESSEKI